MCPLVVAEVDVVGGGWFVSAPDVLAPNNGTVITMAAAPASAAKRAVKQAARNLDMRSSWDFYRRRVAPTRRIHAGDITGQCVSCFRINEETGNPQLDKPFYLCREHRESASGVGQLPVEHHVHDPCGGQPPHHEIGLAGLEPR